MKKLLSYIGGVVGLAIGGTVCTVVAALVVLFSPLLALLLID